jgi:hypothetical protein
MNIFFLDRDPKRAAQMHIDKHVVKMILEYAQLLSTAHRILDGTLSVGKSESGRKKTSYVLADNRDSILYAATHANHPSAVWVRQSRANYYWLFSLFQELMDEYTYRYGKVHSTSRLYDALYHSPQNIPQGNFTDPTPAMPDAYKVAGNGVQSYRNYYIGDKRNMSRWTNREMPTWFADGINTLYGDACYMEHKPKLNRIISMPLSQYANV